MYNFFLFQFILKGQSSRILPLGEWTCYHGQISYDEMNRILLSLGSQESKTKTALKKYCAGSWKFGIADPTGEDLKRSVRFDI